MIEPSLRMVFLVVAAILFALAALYVPPAPPRFSFTAAGLFFLTVSFLFAG
jgi:hypothetical protein